MRGDTTTTSYLSLGRAAVATKQAHTGYQHRPCMRRLSVPVASLQRREATGWVGAAAAGLCWLTHLICLGRAFMKLAAAHPEPSTTTRGLSSFTASCTEDIEGMSVYTGMDSTACGRQQAASAAAYRCVRTARHVMSGPGAAAGLVLPHRLWVCNCAGFFHLG